MRQNFWRIFRILLCKTRERYPLSAGAFFDRFSELFKDCFRDVDQMAAEVVDVDAVVCEHAFCEVECPNFGDLLQQDDAHGVQHPQNPARLQN